MTFKVDVYFYDTEFDIQRKKTYFSDSKPTEEWLKSLRTETLKLDGVEINEV